MVMRLIIFDLSAEASCVLLSLVELVLDFNERALFLF